MAVSIERRGDVALVVVDNPPVNATSQAVRAGLVDAAERIDADAEIRAALLICRGRTFIAGGDVTEFDRPPVEPHLPDVVMRLETAAKPWCAAIHGTALGGGLEIALGCRFRVAAPDAKVGTPEVNIGIIPGAGATIRLPRVAPLPLAARMLSGGKPIGAAQAREAGILDALIEGDLVEGALAFLDDALRRDLPPATLERPTPDAPEEGFWEGAKKDLPRNLRGQTAPLEALRVLRVALEQPASEALADERATHLALRASFEAKALRHLFFAERAAAKAPVAAKPGPVASAGVIGGGLMGAGIAAAFLDAGLPVALLERDAAALERGRANVAKIYEGAVSRGRMSEAQRDAVLARLTASTDMAALAEADVIVEAVFEDLAVKREVFAKLDAVAKPGALLATNTSYIDPGAIAEATSRPGSVVGLHFFSPANVMRLLEVVRPDSASDEAIATAWAVAKTIGKVPVLAGVCEGFIGNRILKVYRRASEALLLDGVRPEAVDAAMRGFGMPMGPFEMQDFAGHDIAAAMRKAARERGETVHAPVSDRLVAEGRIGRKAGAGWYDYPEGSRDKQPSETVAAIVAEECAKAGRTPRALDAEAIRRRILYPMADEGATILKEGIARSAAAVDLVETLGFGFPRTSGGLLFWAEGQGLAKIVAALEADDVFAPSEALREAAAAGSFTALEQGEA
ncbi:3-hydroxyacyl-CoA dehydrogenase NAD-binding domain-containing protein [Salinarimonas sp.]|uniref:3-hydroxyacyl-CoA dehydrogenase NAD-binding domain-containing protein n=1 Tax=Salinarimonas sp. TaxID=2766526 RepID=UPI0032D93350